MSEKRIWLLPKITTKGAKAVSYTARDGWRA